MMDRSETKIPQINTSPKILWIIFGLSYIALIAVLGHSSVISYFPAGSLGVILVVRPLWGISFILRDAVQYVYEDTPEKKAKSSGFWPSMLFVSVGALISLIYADPSVRLASTAAFISAIVVDGIIFSIYKNHSLGYRLLYSNFWAAVVDNSVYMILMMVLMGREYSMYGYGLSIFMKTFPALVIFALETSPLSRLMQLLDYLTTRRIR